MRATASILMAVLILGGAAARADVVHLKNGRTIQGKIVDTWWDRVVVQTPNRRVEVQLDQVALMLEVDAAERR